jgi:hypothetical protein
MQHHRHRPSSLVNDITITITCQHSARLNNTSTYTTVHSSYSLLLFFFLFHHFSSLFLEQQRRQRQQRQQRHACLKSLSGGTTQFQLKRPKFD